MLISKEVNMSVCYFNSKHYRSLGYVVDFAGNRKVNLKVPPQHLTHGSETLIEYCCDDCGKKYSVKWLYYFKKRSRRNKDVCESCAQSNVGKLNLGRPSKLKGRVFNSNLKEQRRYSNLVRDESRKWDYKLSEDKNFDKLGLCGGNSYQIDHIYSISEGFANKIEPTIVGHYCNLRVVTWQENRRKSRRSNQTLAQLKEAINNFNNTRSEH